MLGGMPPTLFSPPEGSMQAYFNELSSKVTLFSACYGTDHLYGL